MACSNSNTLNLFITFVLPPLKVEEEEEENVLFQGAAECPLGFLRNLLWCLLVPVVTASGDNGDDGGGGAGALGGGGIPSSSTLWYPRNSHCLT